jgi:hypothetical protein
VGTLNGSHCWSGLKALGTFRVYTHTSNLVLITWSWSENIVQLLESMYFVTMITSRFCYVLSLEEQ